MTRPATNHTAPRVRYRSPPRDPSPCRTQIWPSDGRGHPWLALHVKSAASPSDSPTRGVTPIGTVRSSTWQIRKRRPGARVPGCGPFKGRFRLRARARRTTHHWIRRVEAAAKQGHDAQVGALLRVPPPLPPHHSPRSRQVPATGSLCFPFSRFFLFYLILRHYGEFT